MDQSLSAIIGNVIPDDHSRQSSAFDMLGEALVGFPNSGSVKLVDLGCGTGESHKKLFDILPNMVYMGVDIDHSPEVDSRTNSDLEFKTFDGVHLPCEDNSIDIIFCKQVLEHVRHPDYLLGDVSRVLKPGGIFAGSVSFLEPYHSFSIFNWSPYGITAVLEDAGLSNIVLRPGIDGLSLTLRNLFGKESFESYFEYESLFNYFLEKKKKNMRRSPKQINAQKLAIAGHICFRANK